MSSAELSHQRGQNDVRILVMSKIFLFVVLRSTRVEYAWSWFSIVNDLKQLIQLITDTKWRHRLCRHEIDDINIYIEQLPFTLLFQSLECA